MTGRGTLALAALPVVAAAAALLAAWARHSRRGFRRTVGHWDITRREQRSARRTVRRSR